MSKEITLGELLHKNLHLITYNLVKEGLVGVLIAGDISGLSHIVRDIGDDKKYRAAIEKRLTEITYFPWGVGEDFLTALDNALARINKIPKAVWYKYAYPVLQYEPIMGCTDKHSYDFYERITTWLSPLDELIRMSEEDL